MLTSSAIFNLAGIFILVCCGGLITGLTLGLMSLDKTNLHILSQSGTDKQKAWAESIKPIRENGHLLLVTMLLASTLVFESLPILVQSLGWGSGTLAVVISTILTLIFGEVVPQAICSRHGLRIGAAFAWPVRILTWIMFIVAYPVACLLDWILGESHGLMYHRAGLKELVAIHSATRGGSLTIDEVTIISGALDLSSKVAADAMTHRRHVVMVDLDSQLDWVTLRDIQRCGHSRVPVFEGTRDNVIGLLLVKNLILLDPEESTPVREVKIFPIPHIPATMSLFDLLNSFQEGASHMAIVMESDADDALPVGIVTLEDVIEELIQEEILDETDVYIDVVKRIRAVRAAVSLPPALKRLAPPQTSIPDENTPLLASSNRMSRFSTPKSPTELHRYSSLDQGDQVRVHLRPGTEADAQAGELGRSFEGSHHSDARAFFIGSY
ncbi:hypothetical protein DSO57_1036351 [Entomophthora muscae]|uniref:Uncharacterized protein n=1 Tax=Entomophthora muscae TaxID=34485 RepID=A0ACC2SN86_9FUNG|nr:hypothetical protein DSO57_1036351 [Entomophthora muscae]